MLSAKLLRNWWVEIVDSGSVVHHSEALVIKTWSRPLNAAGTRITRATVLRLRIRRRECQSRCRFAQVTSREGCEPGLSSTRSRPPHREMRSSDQRRLLRAGETWERYPGCRKPRPQSVEASSDHPGAPPRSAAKLEPRITLICEDSPQKSTFFLYYYSPLRPMFSCITHRRRVLRKEMVRGLSRQHALLCWPRHAKDRRFRPNNRTSLIVFLFFCILYYHLRHGLLC